MNEGNNSVTVPTSNPHYCTIIFLCRNSLIDIQLLADKWRVAERLILTPLLLKKRVFHTGGRRNYMPCVNRLVRGLLWHARSKRRIFSLLIVYQYYSTMPHKERNIFPLSTKFFLAISYKYVIALPQSHPRKYIHVIGPASWHYRVRQLRLCWYMVGQDCNLQPLEVAVYVSSLVLGQDAFVSDLVGEEVHMKANSVKSIVIELLFPL